MEPQDTGIGATRASGPASGIPGVRVGQSLGYSNQVVWLSAAQSESGTQAACVPKKNMGCASTQVSTGKFPIQHRQGVRSGTVHHAVGAWAREHLGTYEWLHQYSTHLHGNQVASKHPQNYSSRWSNVASESPNAPLPVGPQNDSSSHTHTQLRTTCASAPTRSTRRTCHACTWQPWCHTCSSSRRGPAAPLPPCDATPPDSLDQTRPTQLRPPARAAEAAVKPEDSDSVLPGPIYDGEVKH